MSLRAEHLTLTLSGRMVLADVTLELHPGEIVALCGPNGAGKSSLLRTLCREWIEDAGQVTLDARALADWPQPALARRLAVLPQHSTLGFAFTATEVALLGRTPHASGRARDRDIAAAALAWFDAGGLAERLYPRLSGGEKQRVQLARIFTQLWPDDAPDATYALLDEPCAALDIAHQEYVLSALQTFAARGHAVLVVLHDVNFAARLANRIALMRDGQVIAIGTPANIMQAPLLRQVFDVDSHIITHPISGTPLAIV